MNKPTTMSTDGLSSFPIEEPEINLAETEDSENIPAFESTNAAARKSGFETLLGSMTNLGYAIGERADEIDKKFQVSDKVNGAIHGIDKRFRVGDNTRTVGSAVGSTARNIDDQFKIVEKVVNLDQKLQVSQKTKTLVHVTGQKLREIEKTQIVEKTSNTVAKGTDWVTDKVKGNSKFPEGEDDEGW